MKTCATCKHSRPAGDKVIQCRRYPPTITKAEALTVTSHWPLLVVDQTCGEYASKRKAN